MIRQEPASEPLMIEADLALYERTLAVVLASSTFHIQFKTLQIKLGYEPRHCYLVRLFPAKGANIEQKSKTILSPCCIAGCCKHQPLQGGDWGDIYGRLVLLLPLPYGLGSFHFSVMNDEAVFTI